MWLSNILRVRIILITVHLCRILLQIGGSRESPEIVVTEMQEISFGYSTKFQFNSVTHSCLTLCNAAHQASLSIMNTWTLLKLICIESVVLSNHLNLCHALLFLPAIFPSITVFSNESVPIWWPEYWSFSFSISPSSEYSGIISFRIDWFEFSCCPRNSQDSSPTPLFKSINFFDTQIS